MKENPLQKSIKFSIPLKHIAAHYSHKTEIFLPTAPPTCQKFDSCFFSKKKQKKVTKSVEIMVTIIFV